MKILLVDDHALFRDGMHYVLSQLSDRVDILDAGNFRDALEIAKNHPDLDLVLLDLNMPDSEGAASVRLFHERHPSSPIVVISASDQRSDISQVMNSGAMGFISKMSSGATMLNALRVVLSGEVYLPPQLLLHALQQGPEDKHSGRSNEFGLTPRQMEVLQHIARGLSNKDVAMCVGLAEGTVKIHVAAIFAALRVNKRLDAVQAAQRLGLLEETEHHKNS